MKKRLALIPIALVSLLASAPVKAAIPFSYPKFELTSMDGKTFSSLGQRGRATLLVFFARQCLPCRMEVPMLNELATKYPDTLTVLGIGVMENNYSALKTLVSNWGIKYPVIPDSNGSVAMAFRNEVYPHSFLLDYTGRIVADYPGMSDRFTRDLATRLQQMQPKIADYRKNGPIFSVSQIKESGSAAVGEGAKWKGKIETWLREKGIRNEGETEAADYTIAGGITSSADGKKIELVFSNSGKIEEFRISIPSKVGGDAEAKKLFLDNLKKIPYAVGR